MFVNLRVRHPRGRPVRILNLLGQRRDDRPPTVWNSDIGADHLSACGGEWLDQMSQFAGVEGHGQRGLRVGSPRRARVRRHATGQIDRHDGRRLLTDLAEPALRIAGDRSRKAGTEYGIHDELRDPANRVRRCFGRCVPHAQRPGGIPGQRISVPKQHDTNRPARLTQRRGRDQTVATIIARADKYERWPRRPARPDRRRDRLPCLTHQALGADAAFDGEPVAPGDVRRGKNFRYHRRTILWQPCPIVRHKVGWLQSSPVSALSPRIPRLASRRDHGVRDEENRSHH